MSVVSHRKSRRWGVIVLVAGVVLATVIFQTSPGHAILVKTGLFEEPANYTSLAFIEPQGLPSQPTTKGSQNVNVSFVIHNAGGTPHDYQWSVLLVQGGHTDRLAVGNAHVASGNGTTITKSASISCTGKPSQIVVSLARPAESIDAWACSLPGS